MKILLVNLHSSRNAGDHALLEVGLQQLRAAFPGARITLAFTDPASYPPTSYSPGGQGSQKRAHDNPVTVNSVTVNPVTVVESFFSWFRAGRHGENQRHPGAPRLLARLGGLAALGVSVILALIYRWTGINLANLLPARYRPAVAAYLEADLVVSCAGNFIYSRGHAGGLPLLMPLFTLGYGRLAGKPVAMLPQTIGPLWRAWERRAVAWMLRGLQVISVRDPWSVELLDALGLPRSRVHLFPDIAFVYQGEVYQGEGAESGVEALQQFGLCAARAPRPWLGVTLINWGAQNPRFRSQSAYEDAVAQAIATYVRETGGSAALFAQVCGPTPNDDDRVPARRVAAQLAARGVERVHLIDAELPSPTLHAAYAQMDLFLGSRLHSNIFALSSYVPVLAIAYQDKTYGVMRMLGLDAWVEDIERLDGDALGARLLALVEQQESLRATVTQAVAARQQEVNALIPLLQQEVARHIHAR